MSKKIICLKTERLYIIPMTEEELEIQIKGEKDEEAKQAYTEMLRSCEEEPLDYLWFIPWKIILQDSEKAIGNAAFKGPQNKGIVEIGFSILPSLQNQGYMTEALGALIKWAFKQRDVYGITAETAPGNKASQKVLEHNGFVMYANGQDGPRYKILKRNMYKTPFIAGACLLAGIVSDYIFPGYDLLLGVAIFTGVGAVIGVIVDLAAADRRKRILG